MSKLTWEFELRDGATGPAKRMVSSIDQVRASLRGLNADARGGALALGGASQSVARSQAQAARATAQANRRGIAEMRATQQAASEIVGIFGRIGSMSLGITTAAAGIGAAFVGVAMSIGRGLAEMIRFRAGAVTTLGVLLRPRGAGREAIQRTGATAFRQTQEIARMTPASERGVIEARQQVAAAGFRGDEERRALAASLDVNSLNPNDATAQQRFLLGLGQMRNAPRLQLQDVRQTAEAAGLSQADVMRRAAEAAGVTQRQGEADMAYQRRVQSARESGQITGRHGVQAVYQTLSAQTGESLGGFARLQGNSLGGALSNLDESLTGLITSINNLESLPGVRMFTASINAVANALNGSSEAGQRLQAALAPIIDEVGTAFGTLFNPQRVEGFFSGVAAVLPQVFQALKLFGGAFMQGLVRGLGPLMNVFNGDSGLGSPEMIASLGVLAESLGHIVGVAAALSVGFLAVVGALTVLADQLLRFVMWMSTIPTTISAAFQSLLTTFSNVGAMIVDGLIAGLRSGWVRVTDEVTSLAGSLPSTVRGVLGIHSPSKVFAELGGHVASGMAQGITGGTEGVRGAVNDMVNVPRGLGGGVGGGVHIGSVTIEAHGTDAASIVEDIKSQLGDLFGDAFDRAALAGGN